ncbi:MAG: hypothetical protein HQM10_26385 [Candidatus Riflebacteria bacterium]|nr:hypothetical protein [Candidatus Riflebacteria bacterium]
MTKFDEETFTKKRTEDNKRLLSALTDYMEKNPGYRFSQALFNFGFVTGLIEDGQCTVWKNEFSIEPGDILKRLGDLHLEDWRKPLIPAMIGEPV